jgi:hypothetical protein
MTATALASALLVALRIGPRRVKLEKPTPAGTLTNKSVSCSPHPITNSELLPQKHKKAAFAVVLILAVSWLN